MLGALSAAASLASTLFGFAMNKDLRDWLANASNVAFNVRIADFSKATLHFDDVHLHRIYQDTNSKVLNLVKIEGTNSLDVICRKISLSTINNRFDLPDSKDNTTHSLVSYLINQTLDYVQNSKTSPQNRLGYVSYVAGLFKHFLKDPNFKFDLTNSDIQNIEKIAKLNTKGVELISKDRIRAIKLTRIEPSQQIRILDSDRFKRIFIALRDKDFEDSSMPNVYSTRDVLGLGGTPLDQYLSMLHKDTINNKYEFGTLLSCLLSTLNDFLVDTVPQNKADNAADIFQTLITIIIDKDIGVTDNDKKLVSEINTKLARYLGSSLSVNLDKTAGIDASVTNMPPAAKQSSSTSSSAGSAAVDQAQADQNRLLAIAGATFVDQKAKAPASTAVASAQDIDLAAKVELTVSQLKRMEEADNHQAQQPAPAATNAARVQADKTKPAKERK